eukprot:TRINITY_DN27824_c0_g1_i1.p1 TRINITY_DN27824_c0_g1~~TRINITY_DN27824_c0_g1_i1.p1  ORF type:complete len:727 (+),score=140.28 TRINITY_DN27824_c0_g1_i1:77-2182(+)
MVVSKGLFSRAAVATLAFSGQQGFFGSALNCDQVSDPVTERCCDARDAWSEMEAAGGCGDGGATTELCARAEKLCRECQGVSGAHALSTSRISSKEGVQLSSMDAGSLEVQCKLPVARSCRGAVTDVGFTILVLTGVLLLAVATAGLVLFDWRFLPWLVARERRRMLLEAAKSPPSSGQTGTSLPSPPAPVPPAPPTPVGRPPLDGASRSLDSLRVAASAGTGGLGAPEGDTCQLGLPPSSAQQMSATIQVDVAPPEASPASRWPRRLASAWALRRAFIFVALSAVSMRVAYVTGTMALLSEQGIPLEGVPEIVLGVLPLLWVVCTSRPSSSTQGVPLRVAYWGPCLRFPRFTTYAMLAILTELYSTGVAAMAVATTPCDAPPWRGVLLYCLGVLVAVARAYSAVVALRLQDEVAAACRKVVPLKQETLSALQERETRIGLAHIEALPAIATGDIQCNVDCGEGVGDDFEALVLEAEQSAQEEMAAQECRLTEEVEDAAKSSSSSRLPWSLNCFSKAQNLTLEPVQDIDEAEELKLACACLPRSCCPVLRQRLAGKRYLIWGGIFLAVCSAVASIFVVRAVIPEDGQKSQQESSCPLARNYTTTCVPWQLAGAELTDPTTGDMQMDLANTMEDCCSGCDKVSECQAWIFEYPGKRCRWIRFTDEVCSADPGDLRCRCYAKFGTAFGFKPTSSFNFVTADHR